VSRLPAPTRPTGLPGLTDQPAQSAQSAQSAQTGLPGLRGLPSLLIAILLLAAVTSCGYHMGDQGRGTLPGGISTLYIAEVDNPTLDVALPPMLHSLFRDEISKRDLAGWVAPSQAQGLVRLSVVSLSTSSRVTSTAGITLKYQVVVTVRGTLVRSVDQQQIWDSGPVTGSDSFFRSEEESAARRRAMELAVHRLVDSMTMVF